MGWMEGGYEDGYEAWEGLGEGVDRLVNGKSNYI